jgi:hypothetical protein
MSMDHPTTNVDDDSDDNLSLFQTIVNNDEVSLMIEDLEEKNQQELDGVMLRLGVDAENIPLLLEELRELEQLKDDG